MRSSYHVTEAKYIYLEYVIFICLSITIIIAPARLYFSSYPLWWSRWIFFINFMFIFINKQIIPFRNCFVVLSRFPHTKTHFKCLHTLHSTTYCLPAVGLPDLTCSRIGMTSNETQRQLMDCVLCWFLCLWLQILLHNCNVANYQSIKT